MNIKLTLMDAGAEHRAASLDRTSNRSPSVPLMSHEKDVVLCHRSHSHLCVQRKRSDANEVKQRRREADSVTAQITARSSNLALCT